MKRQIVPFVVLFAATILLLPVMAFAQDVATPTPYEDAGDFDLPAADVAAPADTGDVATAEEEPVAQLPLEKRAKVVQKKLYPMQGKHELSLFVGVNPADSYSISLVEGLRYSYHINEMFAVQIVGGYMQNFNRDSANRLIDEGAISNDFLDSSKIQWYGGADFVFYPLYGKFSLMSSLIAHYDVGLYVGCAAMGLVNGEIGPAPDIGLVSNLYFNKWLSLRADFTYYALIAKDESMLKGSDGDKRNGTLLRNNYFITVGLSFHLPVE